MCCAELRVWLECLGLYGVGGWVNVCVGGLGGER